MEANYNIIWKRLIFSITFCESVLFSIAQNTCPPGIANPNAGVFLTENYTNNNDLRWHFEDLGLGDLSISNGVMNFNQVYGAGINRAWANASDIDGDNDVVNELYSYYSPKFRAEFKVWVDSAKCPTHVLFAVSQNSNDFSVNTINNDAIWVDLGTAPNFSIPGNLAINCADINNQDVNYGWRFRVGYKDGSNQYVVNNNVSKIQLPSYNAWYYVRFIRSGKDLCLSVFSDPTFTTHVTGSPDCFDNVVPIANYGPFSFVQHGVIAQTFGHRVATIKVDNLRVYSYNESEFTCTGNRIANDLAEEIQESDFIVYPNPNNGTFRISNARELPFVTNMQIIDLMGRKVKSLSNIELTNLGYDINVSQLTNGIYYIEFDSLEKKYLLKISIQK
jgi:hypothetical protein